MNTTKDLVSLPTYSKDVNSPLASLSRLTLAEENLETHDHSHKTIRFPYDVGL